jgi:DNA modification methylase
VNTTSISFVLIPPSRQRREFDPAAHQELIASIQGPGGLLHPPVLRRSPSGLVLVAGERRLRAITEIFELGGTFWYNLCCFTGEGGEIPYTDLGELSPLEAKEAELEENIRREDLTWQERVTAESELLELRRAQSEGSGSFPAPSDIAKELGARPDTIAKNIMLARNLHRPEVSEAKSPKEAVKALRRVEESERNVGLAQALGKEFLGSKHTLVNGDAIEWMKRQIPGTYDVICTDPPYGMGADEFGDSGGGAAGAHFYEDDAESAYTLLHALVDYGLRLAKPDAHLYVFCDFDKFYDLRGMITNSADSPGWRVFRTPLIWYKPSAFRAPWPEQGPQRKYECILYAVKGGLKCARLGGDVITCPPDTNLGHQAQKPVELYRDLLSRSVRPGMKVLDPFCGTGPIFPAAHSLSAIATGVELDPAAYAIAATRIQKLKEGSA